MSDDPQETGATLELSRATDQLTAALALQATEPNEEHEGAVRRALGDYVTALGSNTTAMLAGGLVGVYKRLDSLIHQSGEQFERIGYQFRAYNDELDTYREQHAAMLLQMQSLTALVEERLVRPFAEMAARVETLEYGYAELADRLDLTKQPQWEQLAHTQDEDRQIAHDQIEALDHALARQLWIWALVIIVLMTVITTVVSVVIHRVLYEAIR